jgi:hypothetical protein
MLPISEFPQRNSRFKLHSVSKESMVFFIIAALIFFNSILRWYPFPVGRSQNDQKGLEDNLAGIVFNSIVFLVLSLISFTTKLGKKNFDHSIIIYLYCIIVMVSAFFREKVDLEIARSLLLCLTLLSADRIGKYIGSSVIRTKLILRYGFFTSAICVFLGLAIGFVIPGSINWGSRAAIDASAFNDTYRAEFFFLYFPAYITFCLGIYNFFEEKNKYLRFCSISVALIVAWLGFLTATRQVMFSIILISCFYFLNKYKYLFIPILFVAVLALNNQDFLSSLGNSLRLTSGDVVNDITNGRGDLNDVNFNSFFSSPFIGVGAEGARENIAFSNSVARSEHGYSIHLASYGIFSLLFYFYVFYSCWQSLNIYFRGKTKNNLVLVNSSLALSVALNGFVGTFGAFTGFPDWFSLFLISLNYAVWDAN